MDDGLTGASGVSRKGKNEQKWLLLTKTLWGISLSSGATMAAVVRVSGGKDGDDACLLPPLFRSVAASRSVSLRGDERTSSSRGCRERMGKERESDTNTSRVLDARLCLSFPFPRFSPKSQTDFHLPSAGVSRLKNSLLLSSLQPSLVGEGKEGEGGRETCDTRCPQVNGACLRMPHGIRPEDHVSGRW